MPILPLVLINGAEGIGTGWSTYIPNYSPREVADNLRRLLAGQPTEPTAPWYRGFRSVESESMEMAGAEVLRARVGNGNFRQYPATHTPPASYTTLYMRKDRSRLRFLSANFD